MTVFDPSGGTPTRARRWSAADGVQVGRAPRRRSATDVRVSGHVVYRAVVDADETSRADLRWNAAAVWVGPNCHLVHYPLRGGEKYNIVVTFHSRDPEDLERAAKAAATRCMSYFDGHRRRARASLLALPK